MKPYAAIVSTKIHSFQYRLTHKIMGTNSKLYKWGMRLAINVTFVNIKKKIIKICSIIVKKFKHSGEKLRDGHKRRLILIYFTSSEILLGTPEDTPPLFDLFLITAIINIYYCKCKGITPNLDGFIRRVNNIKCIEKYIAVKKKKTLKKNTSLQSKMVYYK